MLKFQADRSQVLDRLPLPPISRHLPARYQYFNSRKCYFCHLSHARPDYWRNLATFCRSFTSFIQSEFGWRGSFWQGSIRRYLPFPISVNGVGGGRLIYRRIWARELSIKISANFHNPTYHQCVQNIGNCKLNFLLSRATWFINFWAAIIPGFHLFTAKFRRSANRAILSLAKAGD